MRTKTQGLATMTDFIKELPIEMWDVEALIPYEKNAKLHDKNQVNGIAQSIKKFGWVKSKVLDITPEGLLINGHGRRLAAIQLGMKKVPVVVHHDLSDQDIKAFRIADNKVAESKYDTRLMKEEIIDIGSDFDWGGIISDRELDFAVEDNGEMDLEALTDSLMGDMDDHQANTLDRIDDHEGDEVSINKVFSFSKVSGSQARDLTLLEKYAEGQTGLKGAAALSHLANDLLSA